MQLIYLRFTLPRFDVEAHQAIIGRYLAFVENMNKNPQKIMNDSLTQILTNYHPRTRVMDTEFINEVDLEQVKEVYTERFSDASDFTFYFVGNISKEELLPFVEKYLATLPSKQSNESWVDLNIDEPKGKVTKEIKLSLSVPKSTVFLVFNKEMEYTAENKVLLSMLQGILDLRFTESIREEEGGTYGVRTSASISHFPDEKATLLIMFDTDPLKADHLKGLVYKELENLIKNGPEQKDLSKTIENMLKDRVENREHNSYWMGTLHNYYVQGYNFNNPANFEDIVKSATTKDIKQLMKKLYKGANVVDLVFSPEELPVEE
jgi:zinc protease